MYNLLWEKFVGTLTPSRYSMMNNQIHTYLIDYFELLSFLQQNIQLIVGEHFDLHNL